MQQDSSMLHGNLGDAAIYRAVDGDSPAPQFKVYPGSRLPCIFACFKVILRRKIVRKQPPFFLILKK